MEESTTKGSMTMQDQDWHLVAVTFGCDADDSSCLGQTGVKSIYRDGELSSASDVMDDSNSNFDDFAARGYTTGSGYPAIGGGAKTRFGNVGDQATTMRYNQGPNARKRYYHKGKIGLMAFWHHSFTAQEIEDLYDATKKFYQSCDEGYYCEYAIAYPCPAGYYCPGDWLYHECGGSSVYCPGGKTQVAPTDVDEAFYSVGGGSDSTRTTQTVCPAGYYCVDGLKIECGKTTSGADQSPDPQSYYCTRRSIEPTLVQSGYYSDGYGNETWKEYTRTTEAQCTPGTYCVSGIQSQCPSGTYGSSWGVTTAACDGQCDAGYFCGESSTSPREANCGIGPTPAIYYCEAGASVRNSVHDLAFGAATTPFTAAETNREW